jgi:hypothetical protein
LPFVSEASLSGSAELLFKEPAILLQLGWTAVHLREGTNARNRHPEGRRPEHLPCHPDTLRDALRRVGAAAWRKLQRGAVSELYAQDLVHGEVYAIDGTGLNDDYRLVSLVCVSDERPRIVAWRLLAGKASEKGREAKVTRALIEQAQACGANIRLLLADALYADGPLLAWLKHDQAIDALVRLPSDRQLYEDLQGLARGGQIEWSRHRHVRRIQGRKERHVVDVAAAGGFTSWKSHREAAADYGQPEATLWATLIREIEPSEQSPEESTALVSTRSWSNGFAAFQAFRPRWHIENDAYRELKEGWGIERQRWGRDDAAARAHTTLAILAFNTVQVYRSKAGGRLAHRAIRRLRRAARPHLGPAPAIIFINGCYAVLPIEELLELLDVPVRASILPTSVIPPPS